MDKSQKAPSPENEFRLAAVVEDLERIVNPKGLGNRYISVRKFRLMPVINEAITKNTINSIFGGTVIDLFAVEKKSSFKKFHQIGKYFFSGKVAEKRFLVIDTFNGFKF